MIHTARKAGASANFAGSGGAIVGTYTEDAMFTRLADSMKAIGVALIQPKIVV
jgi:glucuronokinase